MKIGIISTMNGAPWGGSELLWSQLAVALGTKDNEILVSTLRWEPRPVELSSLAQNENISLVERNRESRLSRGFNKIFGKNFPGIFSRYRDLSNAKLDHLLISHGGSYDFMWDNDLRVFLESSKLPYSIICQNKSDFDCLNGSERSRLRRYFHQATNIIFVSTHNRKVIEKELAIKLPQGLVVPNIPNLKNDEVVPFPKDSTFSMASVGRLEVRHKGQDVLLEALSSVNWKKRRWTLAFYGEGPDRSYLEDLVRLYELGDRVKFHGFERDVRRIWKSNKILVLPSRNEGCSLAMIEAMVCGRTVLSTPVGGSDDFIIRNRTGFISRGYQAIEVEEALESAWGKRTQLESIGKESRRVALSKLNPNPVQQIAWLIVGFKMPELESHGKEK